MITHPKLPHRPPPHQAIRARAERRERWRDLGAALGVVAVAALVRLLLPLP